MFLKKNYNLFFYLLFLLMTSSLYFYAHDALASSNGNKKIVNVLSWWGYLDDPQISQIVKNQCGVELSVDTYYSNNEFLRRFKASRHKYDMAIFSETIYDLAKPKLPHSDINLAVLSENFSSTIRDHYLKEQFPHNVVYFMHALTGFLWNPNVVALNQNDTIDDLFKKAGNNIVVMLDDPVEVWNLINREKEQNAYVWDMQYKQYIPLNEEAFSKLIQNSKVYVTNNYTQIYDQPNFAFSFAWSGDALVYIKQAHKPYKFLVHPQLSYISTDLLAALNNKKKTACVAKALMSSAALDVVQNANYYISPYGDYQNIHDAMYQKTYQDIYKNLAKFSWLRPVSAEQYKNMMDAWSQIQLNLHK